MSRWEPNARDRLEQTALELYLERGYEQTTVAEIARRAGLSERTFFRHFADKREVLFGGTESFRDRLLGTLAEQPAGTVPLAAVAAALAAVAEGLEQRAERARRRQVVIAANSVLQERELIKLAGWSTALATGLRERGVGNPRANLIAEAGVAVFRVAYERWVVADAGPALVTLLHESFAELRAEVGARLPVTPSA